MFLDNGPNQPNPGAATLIPEGLLESISDPTLRQHCADLVDVSGQIGQQIDEIGHRPDPTENVVLSETVVNEVMAPMVQEAKFSEVLKQSKIYALAERGHSSKDIRFDNLLHKVIAVSVFARVNDRKVKRKLHGPQAIKIYDLLEYCDHAGLELTTEQISEIRSRLCEPSKDAENRLADLSKTAPGDEAQDIIDDANRKLAVIDEIDPSTALDLPRLVLFANILECFKRPVMDEVRHKLVDLIDNPEDASAPQNIADSDMGAFNSAYDLLARINSGDQDLVKRYMNVLNSAHMQGRPLGIPSSSFRETAERLNLLVDVYTELNDTEIRIKRLHEGRSKHLADRRHTASAGIRELADRALSLFSEFTSSALRNVDFNLEEGAWQEYVSAESLLIATNAAIVERVQKTGLGLDKELEDAFVAMSRPHLEQFRKQHQENQRRRELQPAIDALVARFSSIDGIYHISNKQLRERSPGLPTLAKTLSENSPHQEALDEDTARSLVGLMTGAYWKKAGGGVSDAELADIYLEDARVLRSISEQLKELGQQPLDSHLLKLVNLLDELIDGGIFDSLEEGSELECLVDFALAYIIERDKPDASD